MKKIAPQKHHIDCCVRFNGKPVGFSVVVFSYRYIDSDPIKKNCIPGCLLVHLNIIIQHRHQSSTIFLKEPPQCLTMSLNPNQIAPYDSELYDPYDSELYDSELTVFEWSLQTRPSTPSWREWRAAGERKRCQERGLTGRGLTALPCLSVPCEIEWQPLAGNLAPLQTGWTE